MRISDSLRFQAIGFGGLAYLAFALKDPVGPVVFLTATMLLMIYSFVKEVLDE